MSNPWLDIPLGDYEGHMALPEVGQARMLAGTLTELLRTHAPASLAIVGCAGGNGFAEATEAGVTRLVGIDINPAYLADAKARHTDLNVALELHCADIEQGVPAMPPAALVYAALVFEYVDLGRAVRHLRSICLPGGTLATVLQLPKAGTSEVSPSPFTRLEGLSAIMRLVPPENLREAGSEAGFVPHDEKLITLASGKQFCLQVFKRSLDTSRNDAT